MGAGVPQDYAKAAEWYGKAEAQGMDEAGLELDKLIKEGKI
jgi:TPR repeat protein